MEDSQKTKVELLRELKLLHRRIAELEQAEKRLRQSEGKWRSLVENAPTLVIIVGRDGTILFINYTVPGITREQAIGTSVYDYVLPEHHGTMRESLEQVFQTSESSNSEVAGVGPNGTTSWYETYASPIKQEGRVIAVSLIAIDITERKKAEEALRKSKEKHRSLITNIPDVTWTGDYRGNTIFISPNVEKVYGYTPEEIYREGNQLWFGRIHPDDVEKVKEAFRALFEKGTLFDIEYRIKRKDGKWIWLHDRSVVTYEKDGVMCADGVFSDITERKKVQEQLKESEERYRQVVSTTTDAIMLFDAETRQLIDVNKTCEELYGYSREEFLKLTHYDITAELKKTEDSINKTLKGQLKKIPIRYHRKKDGTVFPVEISASNFELGGHQVLCGVIRDITERQKAEEMLRESEEKWRSLVENAPDVILTVDPKGTILFLNRTVPPYTPEKAVGTSVYDYVPAEYHDIMRRAFEQVVQTGEPCSYELAGSGPDGRTSWYRSRLGPIKRGGQLVALILIATDITEHKQAEDKLRESEERFRTIFDNAADGILVADVESKKFHIGNKAICQMLGYNLEEIKNLTVMDIHRRKDLPYVIEQFEKQSRKQFTPSKDMPVKRKDGSVFYADINSFPITLEGKTYLLGIFRDVTDRKKMEQQLKKEKEQAQEYLKVAGVMLSTLNKDENITMINRKGCEILGYKEEELIGRNWFDILVPERIREEVRSVFHSLMAGNIEPVEYYENPLLTKDGEERLIAFHNAVLRGPNGQIVGTLSSGEDITDRRNSEKALRDSEHKYRVLLENLPQRIFLKDKNSVYVSCNENLAKDLGIKANEIAGKTDYDFLPRKLAEKYRADDKRVVQSGETIDVEEKYNVGGQEAIIRTVKTPVRDQQGNVLGVLGIFWDITELKRAEEQLNEYREKMARAERLASMGTLSATLVHELNQPLTVIRLAIEDSLSELQAKPCPQTVIEGLKDSLDEVANASSIVDRFRNFARQSSEETISEVDLKAVAVRIVRLLSESALRANISLQIRDMDKLPSLYCNEKNMEQLFFALIDNAIHAADGKKNRQLIISGAVKDEYVELQFSDNCGGIAPKNLERIFEPFFTTKPTGEGTGLGLCIVQDITLRAGGKVRVKSKTGKGSTFFVTLPINRDSRFETRSNDR